MVRDIQLLISYKNGKVYALINNQRSVFLYCLMLCYKIVWMLITDLLMGYLTGDNWKPGVWREKIAEDEALWAVLITDKARKAVYFQPPMILKSSVK